MYERYDKPLHAPLRYKSMETKGEVMDEAKVDAAIADLLREEDPDEPEPAKAKPDFPEVPEQAETDGQEKNRETGLAAAIRQKLAELSGAA